MEKTPVLVGTDSESGLPVYRLFKFFMASRDQETIMVFYDQYELSVIKEMNKVIDKHYIIQNIAEVPVVLDENDVEITPAIPAFNGFDNWFNYDIGVFPNGTTLGQVLVASINATLQGIPVDAENGFLITQAI